MSDPFRAARLLLTLRRQGIMDDMVLGAMERVDRGRFVDAAHADLAFEECSLPIACGQIVARPSSVARLLWALKVDRARTDSVLLVGAGSGYVLALLSGMASHVWGVERYGRLVADAREHMDTLDINNVAIRHCDPHQGWKDAAPFDRILVAGAVSEVPEGLLEQLAPDGALVACVQTANGRQRIQRQTANGEQEEWLMPDVLAPLMAGKSRAL